jgi:flagellar motor protein MotB
MEQAALEEKLAQDLDGLIAAGLVDLNDGVVAIRGNLLFGTGSAALSAEGVALIERAVPALEAWAQGGVIMVSGHTDDVPIRGGDFTSNWELSTTRALTVVAALGDAGLPATAVFAAGFGEHRPVASNETLDGRAQNRRVELTRLAAP